MTLSLNFNQQKAIKKWIYSNLEFTYPYQKLDLLFIPEFKQTARESGSCIAIDERFLNTQNYTDKKKFMHFLVFEM
jgi:hypothetical protein